MSAFSFHTFHHESSISSDVLAKTDLPIWLAVALPSLRRSQEAHSTLIASQLCNYAACLGIIRAGYTTLAPATTNTTQAAHTLLSTIADRIAFDYPHLMSSDGKRILVRRVRVRRMGRLWAVW